MRNLIVNHDINEHSKALADYFPGGKLFNSKNLSDNNLRNFIIGLAREFLRIEGYVKALQDEFLPDKTQLFINEWEKALGIPDDCFNGQGNIEKRRLDILVKLASLGVQTVEDFQNVANLFGVAATVYPGEEAPTVPPDPKFTIVVEFVGPEGFPFTFPITFGSETINVLECLFNNLRPANCNVVFTQIS